MADRVKFSWLYNRRPKRDSQQPHVGIDESRVKLENKYYEEVLQQDMEDIDLRQHRRRADHNYELTMARAEVHRYTHMQQLIKQSHIKLAWQSTSDHLSEPSEETHKNRHDVNHVQPLYRSPIVAKQRTPNKDNTLHERRYHGMRPQSTIMPAQPMPRSIPARRPSSTNNRMERRGNTTMNRLQINSAASLVRSPTRSSSAEPVSTHNAPGRSFAELKNLTHIDRLTEQQRAAWRQLRLQEREKRRKWEEERLARRIQAFYEDIAIFTSGSLQKPDKLYL